MHVTHKKESAGGLESRRRKQGGTAMIDRPFAVRKDCKGILFYMKAPDGGQAAGLKAEPDLESNRKGRKQ